jgi:hypothetical protein
MTRILGPHDLQPSDLFQAAGFLKDKFGQHPPFLTAKRFASQVGRDPLLVFGESLLALLLGGCPRIESLMRESPFGP